MLADLFLFFVALAVFLLILIGLEGVIVLWELGRNAGRPDPYMMAEQRKAGRYPDCITCEGAEGVSQAELMRHQTRDHGGIRW